MYRVDIENKQGNIFEVKAGKNELVIEPLSDNFSPGEVLLASLGSCIGFYSRRYLDNAKMPFQGLNLRLEAEFSKDSPMRFKEIKVTMDIKGFSFSPERREAFLKFIENCPIQNTLKGKPAIELDLK
jgi:putative redox protein